MPAVRRLIAVFVTGVAGHERCPALDFVALATFGDPCEWRKHDEVQQGDHHRAEERSDGGGDSEIPLPQPAPPRAPDLPAVRARRNAGKLRVGVVHMEHFVAQDLLEDRTRRGIVVHELAVDREAACRRFLGDVEEREQPVIGLAFDAEIVKAMAARERVAVEASRRSCRALPEQRRAALAEQMTVVQLVDRMFQVQPPQERVRCELGSPQDVASAVGFDLSKRQQFAYTAVEIAPDPLVHRSKEPVHRRQHLYVAAVMPRPRPSRRKRGTMLLRTICSEDKPNSARSS